MCRHRIAEMPFPQNEPLIRTTAENPGQPFAMDETKHCRGHEKGNAVETREGHLFELRLNDVTIEEGTIKHLLHAGHHEGAAQDSCDHKEPGKTGALAKLRMGIPRFVRVKQLRLVVINSDPDDDD